SRLQNSASKLGLTPIQLWQRNPARPATWPRERSLPLPRPSTLAGGTNKGRSVETELTTPVSLTTNRGLLNHGAIGWARRPLVDTDGLASTQGCFGRRAWGRNKRWEYWNVMTPSHIIALTVSNID